MKSKVTKSSSHYVLAGSLVVGEGFLDSDGSTIVLRLAEGASLHWQDRTKLRLLSVRRPTATASLPAESVA
jgi:hypothetical protein